MWPDNLGSLVTFKEQGMVSFVHEPKNAKVTELSLYEDAIRDAYCQNIPADDELWHQVIEVSVLLLTCTKRSNPRSPWRLLRISGQVEKHQHSLDLRNMILSNSRRQT